MTLALRARLADAVADAAGAPVEASALRDETVLLEGGIALGSLQLFDLALTLLERFGVRVPPEDLTLEHFGTFGRLVAYVERHAVPDASPGPTPSRPGTS